jgi:hypothetical protein
MDDSSIRKIHRPGQFRGGCVKKYKLYCLDHAGRSVEVQDIVAASDEQAIVKAQAVPGLRKCEVWRDNHLIAKVTQFAHFG